MTPRWKSGCPLLAPMRMAGLRDATACRGGANGLGFHDILGNVWEWMANPYDPRDEAELKELSNNSIHYSRKAPDRPPQVTVQRAIRGGLWYFLNILATSTNRWRLLPDDYEFKRGFRVVREWRPE